MNRINPFSYLGIESEKPELPEVRQQFYRTLYAFMLHVPLLSIYISQGFFIIYLLGLYGLLEYGDSRLLIISGLACITAIVHLPLFRLMRVEQYDTVAIYFIFINSTASALQVFFWQEILWFPIIASLFPVLLFISQSGMKFKFRLAGAIYGFVLLVIIVFIDLTLTYERMNITSSLTNFAALTIYIMVALAMAALIILNSLINFRSISSRLTTTFTFIALLSSLMFLVITGLANVYFDQRRVFLALNAASKTRSDQVLLLIMEIENDVSLSLADSEITKLISTVLNSKINTKDYLSSKDRLETFIRQLQAQNSKYQEIFLFDKIGTNILSTQESNSGKNFSKYNFFSNIKMGINYSVENDFPSSHDQSSIILVKPISQNGELLGAVGVRVNFDNVKSILSAATGLGYTAETYLVSYSAGSMIPLSNTRNIVSKINSEPAEQALIFQSNYGSGVWYNYMGTKVLGSYVRIPAIKAVLISEIEQQEVTQNTLRISSTNAIVALFTILLTFSIVLITSRSIATQIVVLSNNTTRLANGELGTRIPIFRIDELGTLAANFNTMASELQSLVDNLDVKVADRTKELSRQTDNLRIAAEVTRDATASNSLDELLNRAAKLILDRFGFYHTGIFLLDQHKEFAILRASPTKAGIELIAQNHRFKIGQVGIVAHVAASGSSRIVLDTDTGQDKTFLNNPLLPNTRSEVALPLQVNSELLGVLDVQSDQPQAFSQDDVGILQIMADQLALAIQHIQLTQKQAESLRQLEAANQRFTYASWNQISKNDHFPRGYSYDGLHLVQIDSVPEEIKVQLSKGHSIIIPEPSHMDRSSTLAVPLKLRDQIIGILMIRFNNPTISSDTISMVEATALQLGLALENARLYSETQKAAERERTVSQITSKIRSTNDPNEMIRIAINEIKHSLHASDAKISSYRPNSNQKKN